ncbi:Predicted unusual protein kinase regulating ubiquinone biosynthesis, AarF/ABC1/UbiB family [Marinospirillum celere]|uniref:Predicted unusual protein kinase regulating ubiquinone biosynthesis, AarF/ABC1/UbiB family n=1 Tax=Marinospirillum celere TaxID=1122252 RepID=A0A1I1E3C1_9GAMM|nr:AarF/ABC1/UbiB kinase family protein [Marinospirillum celere]SFB79420.1 Predicted unusual protein kinase regulating ubiquinone biosynthesis, AarF/ABC1/UbiB family [Marinospirillum celere]
MTNRPMSRLNSGRLSRMSQLGRLAGGMAGSIVTEGVRRWRRGESWDLQQQALTPANLSRLSNRLSQMRGAAMKLGQLLSMDAGHLMPPELAQLLARLRNDAHSMPLSQLEPVLTQAWGKNWHREFKLFSYQPLASASIGQVHKAVTKNGQCLAIKVQYPGVIQSIESDLDNVAALLRWSRLLPEKLDIGSLLKEAKAQLTLETDYQHEAEQLETFKQLLSETNHFILPEVNYELSKSNILAMSFLQGSPIEQLENSYPEERQRWVRALFELFFRELFEFKHVQTDPNYANFLIDSETQRLGLIDFGAAHRYPEPITIAYRDLLKAALSKDEPAICHAAHLLGYFASDTTANQKASVIQLFYLATEPLTQPGLYDFGASNLPDRLREASLKLSFEQNYWHAPPIEALLLHRKLAGLFLLAQRLGVKLDITAIAEPYLEY